MQRQFSDELITLEGITIFFCLHENHNIWIEVKIECASIHIIHAHSTALLDQAGDDNFKARFSFRTLHIVHFITDEILMKEHDI